MIIGTTTKDYHISATKFTFLMSVLLVNCLAFAIPTGVSIASAASKRVNWKHDCPIPPGSMKRSGGARVFTLKHGQKGRCPTDKGPRGGAPYWERSEVRSTDFRKGKTYTFSVDVNFDPTTKSSNKTAFFQVGQWKKGTCTKCPPAIMLKANANGAISTGVSQSGGKKHSVYGLKLKRSQIAGKWTTFSVRMGTSNGVNEVLISAGGRNLFKGKVYVDPRGAIFVQTGVYRPGNKSGLPNYRVSIRNARYDTAN
jgi:hypothetical protein